MSTKLQTHFGMCAATWLAFLAALPSGHASENVPRFCCEAPSAPAQFVKEEITRAAGTAGVHAPELVELTVGDQDAPQSYRIERDGGTVRVVGADITGLIYGGLDVAEAIRLGTFPELKAGEHRPYIAQRGIKFNIPLDLRTPSYSDNSDAAQANRILARGVADGQGPRCGRLPGGSCTGTGKTRAGTK